MAKAKESGITYYSDKVAGAKANYDRAIRYDYTDGFVGITAFEGAKVVDRVLLSPIQVGRLLEFLKEQS